MKFLPASMRIAFTLLLSVSFLFFTPGETHAAVRRPKIAGSAEKAVQMEMEWYTNSMMGITLLKPKSWYEVPQETSKRDRLKLGGGEMATSFLPKQSKNDTAIAIGISTRFKQNPAMKDLQNIFEAEQHYDSKKQLFLCENSAPIFNCMITSSTVTKRELFGMNPGMLFRVDYRTETGALKDMVSPITIFYAYIPAQKRLHRFVATADPVNAQSAEKLLQSIIDSTIFTPAVLSEKLLPKVKRR